MEQLIIQINESKIQLSLPPVVALTVRVGFEAVIGRAVFVTALVVVDVVFFAIVDVTPASIPKHKI